MAKGIAKGRTEGRTEGMAEGMAKGRTEGRAESVRDLIKYGMSIEEIAQAFGCSPHEIEKML